MARKTHTELRDKVGRVSKNWQSPDEDRFPVDARLRQLGYIIWRRPQGQEPVWREPGWGKEVSEAEALEVLARMDEEIEEALKSAG